MLPSDLAPGYPPAARLYLTWTEVSVLAAAACDGVHPIKVVDELSLDHLVVVVVPKGALEVDVPDSYMA